MNYKRNQKKQVKENKEAKGKRNSYFPELSDRQKKLVRKLIKEHNIDYGFAVNVCIGKYSIEIAKQKQRLKNRGMRGLSNDIFDVCRRWGGSYC